MTRRPAVRRPPWTGRPALLAGSAAVTMTLLLILLTPRAPYAIESPGPTFDTLGEVNGEPLITVTGAPTYPTAGALAMTTVLSVGGPSNPVGWLQVLRGWLSGDRTVLPAEVVYPRELAPDAYSDLLAAQMTSSQEDAAVAALTELGYEVPAELVVAGTVSGSGADGVLAEGDVLRAVAGRDVPTFRSLVDLLATTPPGTPVQVEVSRGADDRSLEVVTGDDDEGGSVLGVLLDPTYDLPVDVEVRIDDVGGPSAGLMFALGIVDLMTPGPLTAGARVAGTGTIAPDGAVGSISGVALKVAGAERDGADWFLASEEDCADAREAAGASPRVVGVATLADARDAVEAIAEGRLGDVPGCPA